MNIYEQYLKIQELLSKEFIEFFVVIDEFSTEFDTLSKYEQGELCSLEFYIRFLDTKIYFPFYLEESNDFKNPTMSIDNIYLTNKEYRQTYEDLMYIFNEKVKEGIYV